LSLREKVLKIKRNEQILENEVIQNGFERVLHPTDGKYKHLSEVVKEKLKHPEHIKLGLPLYYDEMLSIALYTGTDVYKDLRDNEIAGNYEKWKVMSTTLESALHYLGES
jgi:hypothetical protein